MSGYGTVATAHQSEIPPERKHFYRAMHYMRGLATVSRLSVRLSLCLDDLERPLHTLFQHTYVFGAHHENVNEDGPTLSTDLQTTV